MDANSEKFWTVFLAGLPESEKAAGLALIREGGTGRQGGILRGFLALHHAAGLNYLEATEKLGSATDHAKKIADDLSKAPEDLAKKMLAEVRLDVEGLSKSLSGTLAKSLPIDTLAILTATIKATADNLSSAGKTIDELAPNLEAKARLVGEATKGLTVAADKATAAEKNNRDLIRDLGQDYIRIERGQRVREWGLAAALALLIFCPVTWTVRGWGDSTTDLAAIVAHNGGELAYSNQAGCLKLALYGGTTTTDGAWNIYSFPPPKPSTSAQK